MKNRSSFQFHVNGGNSVRHETFEGRDHLVVPVVAVVEGVLNGQFLPFEEIAAFPQSWEGRPIPISHPRVNGWPVTANSPAVLQGMNAGRFFNVYADERGRSLKGELWIDVEKVKTIEGGAQTITILESADGHLEVSTAYWNDIETGTGEFKGKSYSGIQRNLRPDHLAMLPNQVGACSWTDGCGAPRMNATQAIAAVRFDSTIWSEAQAMHWLDEAEVVGLPATPVKHNNQLVFNCACAVGTKDVEMKENGIPAGIFVVVRELKRNALQAARVPAYNGIESTPWGEVPRGFAAFRDGYYASINAARPADAPTTISAAVPAMKEWIASKSLLGSPTGNTLRDLLFLPVVNPSTNKLNANALKLIVNGKAIKLFGNVDQAAIDSAKAKATELLAAEFPSANDDPEEAILLCTNGKALGAMVTKMITDQSIGDSSETLDDLKARICAAGDMTPEGLQALMDGVIDFPRREWLDAVATVLDTDLLDLLIAADSDTVRYRSPNMMERNSEQETAMDKKAIVDRLIANAGTIWKEEDRAYLMGKAAEDLQKLEPPATNAGAGAGTGTGTGTGAGPGVTATTPSMEAFLATVPAELRSVFLTGLNNVTVEKAALVTRLSANKGVAFTKEELEAMPFETLDKIARSVDVTYLGQGGTRMRGLGQATNDNDAPPEPPKVLTGPVVPVAARTA